MDNRQFPQFFIESKPTSRREVTLRESMVIIQLRCRTDFDGSITMLQKPLIIAAMSLCGVLGSGLALQSVSAATTSAPGEVGKYDKVSDQTLDLAELKTAASAHFDKLDKDADGTLDSKEVQGVIGPKEFKAADSDNDGTLSKDEYLALVERLFNKLDVDHDGTLSVQELRSKTARALKQLID